MSRMLHFVTLATAWVALTVAWQTPATADDKPPGGIRLMDGYTHERLQGFDSVPGRIAKEGGLQIQYEIGSIPKPGQPRLGGQFSDSARGMREDSRLWYKEQVIGGQPVHLALSKDKLLRVAFPQGGINFSVKVTNSEELAEALLIILSYANATDVIIINN